MRYARSVFGMGIAAVAAIGLCGVAAAQSPQDHVMTVRLPGGGVAEIHYTGPVAPRVRFDATPTAIGYVPMSAIFGSTSPFAELDRISAAMDRQAAAMLQQAAALAAAPTAANIAEMRTLPVGSQGYEFISTMSGNGVCSRSVTITSEGNGAAPRVVTHSSGNCAATPGWQVPAGVAPLPNSGPATIMTTAPAQPAAPAPSSGPRLIMTKAKGAEPYAGRIEEAALH